MREQKTTPEDIAAAYGAGENLREIGARIGFSTSCVWRRINERADAETIRARHFESRAKPIREAFANGCTRQVIALDFGVSDGWVRKVINDCPDYTALKASHDIARRAKKDAIWLICDECKTAFKIKRRAVGRRFCSQACANTNAGKRRRKSV